MGFRVDRIERFDPLHQELRYKRDDGYTIRFSKDDIGKLFTAKYQFAAKNDPDVGDRYGRFDCHLIGKMYGGAEVDVVACTKDKPQPVQDPDVGKQDLHAVGTWSLPSGGDPGRVTQRFDALRLGTVDATRFLLVLGIRVVACTESGRVKLRTLEYVTG